MNSLFISAIHKSSGKTILSIGLSAALNKLGKSVQTFKKGPDYIDPMWLSKASKKPCRNLDFHFMNPNQIVLEFKKFSKYNDYLIVEGNKGLFDGLSLNGSDSNAALAKLLKVPVILIIDTRGMTRGIAPLLLGQINFDEDINIIGTVLNQVGGSRHEKKLCAAIEKYTNIPVLGSIPQSKDLQIIERHLGLMPANEHRNTSKTISIIENIIQKNVDLTAIGDLTKRDDIDFFEHKDLPPPIERIKKKVTIAIARDNAFGFYYPSDLEALERAGAKLVFFNTIKNKKLPHADGLFIGGGFPETNANAISNNANLRHQIRQALCHGLPAYAECGGLMYLSESIFWKGEIYEMVGVIPGNTVMNENPIGRGYVSLSEMECCPWPNKPSSEKNIPGHEFHYAKILNLPPNLKFAFTVKRGIGVNGKKDGIIIKNLIASFSHLFSTPEHDWADRFVQFVHEHKINQKI